MGLLNGVAAGLAGSTEFMLEDLKAQIAEKRQMALEQARLDMQSQQHRADKEWEIAKTQEIETANEAKTAGELQTVMSEHDAEAAAQPGGFDPNDPKGLNKQSASQLPAYERYRMAGERLIEQGKVKQAQNMFTLSERFKPKDQKFSHFEDKGGTVYTFEETTGAIKPVARGDVAEYHSAGKTLFVFKKDEDGNPYPVGVYQDEVPDKPRAETDAEFFQRDPDGYAQFKKTGEAPTASQHSNNLEIQKARELIADLSPEEIKRRTAKFTDTGRESDDYDSTLESSVKLAHQRKVGDDPWFDAQQAPKKPKKEHYLRTIVEERFKADKDMAGYSLGKDAPQGIEVLDANGKLVGHYK
jgi:hypothetical protein